VPWKTTDLEKIAEILEISPFALCQPNEYAPRGSNPGPTDYVSRIIDFFSVKIAALLVLVRG
jgi:hypothetical protein